ncbi:Cysteine-rich protein 2-binding protein, partial [Nowakowskiella sp. JEL0078]
MLVIPTKTSTTGLKFYHVKQDICSFIDNHWDIFWNKTRITTWKNNVASSLSTGGRFISGNDIFEDQGWWALDSLVLPSYYSNSKRPKPAAFDIEANGSLRECPIQSIPSKKRKTQQVDSDSDSHSAISGPRTKRTRYYESDSENIFKKSKKSKKQHRNDEEVDPSTAISMYFDIENPLESVKLSSHATHSAPQMRIVDEGFTAFTEK